MSAAGTREQRWLVGVGRAEIALPPEQFPIDGFVSVHDPLSVRILLVADRTDRAAFVSVEMTSLSPEDARELQRLAAEHLEIDPAEVTVAATHTFSAPHLPAAGGGADATALERGALLRVAVHDAVRRAAQAAAASTRPARLTLGAGTCRIAVNRDVATADGRWLGADETGVTDPRIDAAIWVGDDGDPVAVLFSAAVQSSVMNEVDEGNGQRSVTADLAGAASRFVEERCPGAVAVFLIGAAGDQAPALKARRTVLDADGRPTEQDAGRDGHLITTLLGERLGAAVVRCVGEALEDPEWSAPRIALAAGAVHVAGQVAPASFRDLHPSLDHEFVPDGEREVPYWIAILGTGVFVGLQAELSCRTGIWLRDRMPGTHLLLATMVNGSAKYLPDRSAYERITYEAMSARFGVGAAEATAAEIVEAATRLVAASA